MMKTKLYLIFILCKFFNSSRVIRFHHGLEGYQIGEVRHDYGDGRAMIKVSSKYCLVCNITPKVRY